jgi:hypothetical protein
MCRFIPVLSFHELLVKRLSLPTTSSNSTKLESSVIDLGVPNRAVRAATAAGSRMQLEAIMLMFQLVTAMSLLPCDK